VFLYLYVLLRFGNTLGLMPLSAPPSREPTRMGTSYGDWKIKILYQNKH
jgi:hypothetical protein